MANSKHITQRCSVRYLAGTVHVPKLWHNFYRSGPALDAGSLHSPKKSKQ